MTASRRSVARTQAQLRPVRSAPSIARRAVRTVCTGAGIAAATVDDAVLVASELVALSVRQARSELELNVDVVGGIIRVLVADRGADSPLGVHRHTAGSSPARSAEIVRRLSESWGYEPTNSGRVMWAVLSHESARVDRLATTHRTSHRVKVE
jgi:hypothetical protein